MERVELARRLLGERPSVAEASDRVVVEAREPARFRAAFADAVASGGTVFLANPDWGAAERGQFNALCSAPSAQPPSTAGGSAAGQSKILAEAKGRHRPNPKSETEAGWLCIPTGGSSGVIRLARHDQDTLHAAVRGFAAHFGVARVNALGVLPLHHVGGLMGWLRAELTGGIFLDGDWKRIVAGELPVLPRADEGWFISLVPTQLQRLLARPEAVAWLRGFRAVLVGGGPVWPELVQASATVQVPLALTYGATETAAAVAALRPEEFLAGGRGCGTTLPHGRLGLGTPGASASSPESTDTDGAEIVVEAESLFRGYWPEWRPTEELRAGESGAWATGDLGFFDARGSLHVTGRRDARIITGGEKVGPEEVEAALRATGEFADVAVVGVPDAEWGEAVVACYPAADGAGEGGWRAPDMARVAAGLATLAVWKRPKRFVAVADWPRDAAGKVIRPQLAARARTAE
jgi:O-succinylbenzoic acid--CoA ligase